MAFLSVQDVGIIEFPGTPSMSLFERSCLKINRPAVLRQSNLNWPAINNWNPTCGGLEYLKDLTGKAQVQVMASSHGSTFYGAIGRHERIEASFEEILDLALNSLEANKADQAEKMSTVKKPELFSEFSGEVGEAAPLLLPNEEENGKRLHVYLAQAPIMIRGEAGISASLHPLLADISIPDCVEENWVTSVNLWMSVNGSRSSTHYDPYHNLLCPIAGERKVTLWPPSSTSQLYPLALSGEASNHSAVDFTAPDYVRFPLYREAEKKSLQVTISPGDALFIPEGWWHQVDASDVALAINIWWASVTSVSFGSHMDSYFARRIISSLVDAEKKHMLENIAPYPFHRLVSCPNSVDERNLGEEVESSGACGESPDGKPESSYEVNKVVQENTPVSLVGEAEMKVEHGRQQIMNRLTEEERELLKALVLSAAHVMKENQQKGFSGIDDLEDEDSLGNSQKNSAILHGKYIFTFEDDIVAQIFATLEPLQLRRVLQAMATGFPMSLRMLILYGLSPASVELLTTKLESADELELENNNSQHGGEKRYFGPSELICDNGDFYEQFYSVFDDRQEVMEVFLAAKEKFANLALKTVLKGVLGVDCAAP